MANRGETKGTSNNKHCVSKKGKGDMIQSSFLQTDVQRYDSCPLWYLTGGEGDSILHTSSYVSDGTYSHGDIEGTVNEDGSYAFSWHVDDHYQVADGAWVHTGHGTGSLTSSQDQDWSGLENGSGMNGTSIRITLLPAILLWRLLGIH